jgi:hypothetical protein
VRVLRAEREWSQADLAKRTAAFGQPIEAIFDPSGQ